MNFPFFVAKRYLITKKSRNAINIISLISILGVAVGTAALIIVMSVFNGFNDLLTKLNNSFDPDIKITPKQGKVFDINNELCNKLNTCNYIKEYSFSLEENALVQYNDKQIVAIMKGVDENYFRTTGIDTMLISGTAILHNSSVSCAVLGGGLAYTLGVQCDYINPITINVPSRTKQIQGNFSDAANDLINSTAIYASAIFAIQQDYDNKYIILPLNDVCKLLELNNVAGALEIKLHPKADVETAVCELKKLVGEKFLVCDRNMQHAYTYKIMQSEKWAIFMILIFILLIASFNIIASITMLIIDKQHDIKILRSMGASNATIRKIFFAEGMGISLFGATVGLIFGATISYLQMRYGFVKLGDGSGSFIIDAYPVKLVYTDLLYSFTTVIIIGIIAAWIPVKYVTNKLKINN